MGRSALKDDLALDLDYPVGFSRSCVISMRMSWVTRSGFSVAAMRSRIRRSTIGPLVPRRPLRRDFPTERGREGADRLDRARLGRHTDHRTLRQAERFGMVLNIINMLPVSSEP